MPRMGNPVGGPQYRTTQSLEAEAARATTLTDPYLLDVQGIRLLLNRLDAIERRLGLGKYAPAEGNEAQFTPRYPYKND